MSHPKTLQDYPEVLRAKEVAEILQVGYTNALRLVKYEMHHLKIGNTFLVRKDELVEWMKSTQKIGL